METNITYRKLSDFKKFEENPFIDIDLLKKDLKRKKTSLIIDKQLPNLGNTEEDAGYLKLEYKKITYDFSSFYKVYPPFFQNLRRINKPGIDILSILYEKITYGNTTFFLIEQEVQKDCGWKTKKNFYKGLVSLIKNEYLACSTTPHKFFLNPYMMFQGDLSVLIREKKLQT